MHCGLDALRVIEVYHGKAAFSVYSFGRCCWILLLSPVLSLVRAGLRMSTCEAGNLSHVSCPTRILARRKVGPLCEKGEVPGAALSTLQAHPTYSAKRRQKSNACAPLLDNVKTCHTSPRKQGPLALEEYSRVLKTCMSGGSARCGRTFAGLTLAQAFSV